MDEQLLATMVSTFTVALLHTAIPSHWLCFVAVGKAQGWTRRRLLGVAAFAGTVHVLVTIGLGIAAVFAGRKFVEEAHFNVLSAALLVGVGALYLGLHFAHVGHRHEEADRRATDRWALAGLVLAVTVSPCSLAIPLLLMAAAQQGVAGVLLLSGVLVVTTVGMMVLLVGLTSLGVEKLRFQAFDRYEKLILGLVLAALGALIFVFDRGH